MKGQFTETESFATYTSSAAQRAFVGHRRSDREAAALFRKWPTDFLGSTKNVISR